MRLGDSTATVLLLLMPLLVITTLLLLMLLLHVAGADLNDAIPEAERKKKKILQTSKTFEKQKKKKIQSNIKAPFLFFFR